ncbi:hypothetical protein QC764_0032440 [Podospora pseudoanserina]|uniref:Uncharacterized protein n=1 Tax=Podospora pseudoanserina TaxID=2609844 RepID=A0ABR0IFL5_9PEZI|nr:hypothetical protein QC764_0032440 [Podospora pseudoanserina]
MEKCVHGTLTVSPETGAFSVLHHEDAAWQNETGKRWRSPLQLLMSTSADPKVGKWDAFSWQTQPAVAKFLGVATMGYYRPGFCAVARLFVGTSAREQANLVTIAVVCVTSLVKLIITTTACVMTAMATQHQHAILQAASLLATRSGDQKAMVNSDQVCVPVNISTRCPKEGIIILEA